MKKFSEIFLTGVFGIFLIVSMVMTVSNREDVYSYYENRLYAEMPEISAENVIEGDFFNQLESFLCDHAAGRQTLVKAKTETDIPVSYTHLDVYKRQISSTLSEKRRRLISSSPKSAARREISRASRLSRLSASSLWRWAVKTVSLST